MLETDADTIAVLGGPDDAVTGFTISSTELPFALDDMHSAMMTLVTRLHATDLDFVQPSAAIAWGTGSTTIEALAVDARQTLTELVHEVHGREHRVIVSEDGSVVVEHVGGDRATYPSLEIAREKDPEAVAPLAAFLRRK
jgi:sulfur carrier protein ThiS